MMHENSVKAKVTKYYWQDDLNCAATTLQILADEFSLPLNQQVIDAAVGMHGAGRYGAQCGLVEGALLFLGIFGRANKLPDRKSINNCRNFARKFENEFGSLQCSILRPGGFTQNDPPHLCEDLTNRTVRFTIEFIRELQGQLSNSK